LHSAGVGRVVFAARDPNPRVAGEGARQLEKAGILVTGGILAAEAQALNVGFFSRLARGRPHVRSKLAVSLDGRTGLADGESRWISSEISRADVQRWRARSSAILTGVGTVIRDNPSLTVRADDLGDVRQPERIILDSQLRTPVDSRLLHLPGTVRVFCTAAKPAQRDLLAETGARVEVLPAEGGRVSLRGLLGRLAELEINEILVEAGQELNGALLAAGLLDELVVYMAPHVLGSDARGMFAIPPLTGMADRVAFDLTDVRRVGPDCRMIYRPLRT
jgi:diaminohydroxyphosphoribosylaminopyrimidine deaminase/5-amino-6-(5-phosphoribosylamino)uracil reductase